MRCVQPHAVRSKAKTYSWPDHIDPVLEQRNEALDHVEAHP